MQNKDPLNKEKVLRPFRGQEGAGTNGEKGGESVISAQGDTKKTYVPPPTLIGVGALRPSRETLYRLASGFEKGNKGDVEEGRGQ